ncbi:MAG TPA: hypothetical protein VHR55_03835 [Candidatus Limnocylindria bacterium]|nr:hypothetical protein [Candidatus Limnocylindria bacterium]
MAQRPGVVNARQGRDDLAISLTSQERRQLAELAGHRGMESSALATSLVRTGIMLLRLATVERRQDQGLVIDRLEAVQGRLDEHGARLEAIERAVEATADIRRRGDASGDQALGHPRHEPSRAATPSLHDEIIEVLRASNGPMSASDIAEEIHRRGRYQARRAAKPLSGATISSRVSNPYYRDLFRRKNRKITLAD